MRFAAILLIGLVVAGCSVTVHPQVIGLHAQVQGRF